MERQSFSARLIHGQRGNALLYIVGFAVLWFMFFTVKDWLKETKEARYGKPTQEQTYYGDPYLDNAARNGK